MTCHLDVSEWTVTCHNTILDILEKVELMTKIRDEKDRFHVIPSMVFYMKSVNKLLLIANFLGSNHRPTGYISFAVPYLILTNWTTYLGLKKTSWCSNIISLLWIRRSNNVTNLNESAPSWDLRGGPSNDLLSGANINKFLNEQLH
jgi:hypothetical protein